MNALAQWWDGVELWTTGLPFVVQVFVVMAVVLPLAAGVSVVLDRVSHRLLGRVRRRRP